MYWIREMQNAINYIEDRLLDDVGGDIGMDEIARHANSSSANFQKIFSIVTGMTVGNYIRCRRLSLAGAEVAERDAKLIDISLKYGYETAESFTKAFTRFHGVTPSEARRKHKARRSEFRHSELKQFLPLSIKIDVRGGFNMQRKLISNVPVIHYDGNNAGICNTLLMAALQSMGEECDRAKLTALSGDGNRFCWKDGEWVFGNELPDAIDETPFETQIRVLNAVGWKAKCVTVQRDRDGEYVNIDAAQIRRDFVESFDRGFPVIARYGKQDHCDMNLFFGYEDDGQKVLCYHYANGFEPGVSPPTDIETPVAEDHWEDNIAGYILLLGKKEAASARSTALAAFKWISWHARSTTEIRGKRVGFAAWESYLHHLEHDDFSGLSFEEVKARFFIYCDGLCQIFERNQALDYYRALSEQFPEWREDLQTAIDKLKVCACYGGYLWEHGFTFDDPGFEKFRDPAARKMLAEAGREALRNDREAVALFESILRREQS